MPLSCLSTVTTRKETHFGQYWGLEALQRRLPWPIPRPQRRSRKSAMMTSTATPRPKGDPPGTSPIIGGMWTLTPVWPRTRVACRRRLNSGAVNMALGGQNEHAGQLDRSGGGLC
jgi:hypothetical protein